MTTRHHTYLEQKAHENRALYQIGGKMQKKQKKKQKTLLHTIRNHQKTVQHKGITYRVLLGQYSLRL